MNLFVKFFTLPISFAYFSFTLIMFIPLQMLYRIRPFLRKMISRLLASLYSSLTSFVRERIKTWKSTLKTLVRICRAILRVMYVLSVLVGMLIFGFMIGGFVTKHVIERPIQVRETLNFDYTMAHPVALVSLGNGDIYRAIPYNRKLEITVSLTVPESDYNRNIGVFQVRVDFLSTTGKTTSTASYPGMLRFKSQPIHIAETVLKSVPLIIGFQAQVQKFKIKMDHFIERKEPPGSVRVILEQRARYESDCGGIPHVYAASLNLRSELSMIKRVLWAWRITVFVWVSMMSFFMQFLFVFIFFRGALFP